MSKDWQSQAHVKWDCKFHVVMFGRAFWTRGYCAVTVGEYDEAAVREYIREQEKLDRDSDQGTLDFE